MNIVNSVISESKGHVIETNLNCVRARYTDWSDSNSV